MTDTILKKETDYPNTFKLGRICFTLKNPPADLSQDLQILLPTASADELASTKIEVIEVGDNVHSGARAVFDEVLRRHEELLWIRGCCLVNDRGQQIIISGHPGSGKSTLVIALALKHQWKVISEDVVLIDLTTMKVINFALPFSIKEGSIDRLMDCINQAPKPILANGWCPQGEMAATQFETDARFDAIVVLGGWRPRVTVNKLTANECVRKLLGLSSIMKHHAVEAVTTILQDSKCVELRGGTVQERITAISNICS